MSARRWAGCWKLVVSSGIEDYSELPAVPYAIRDASAFEQFLLRSRGVPSSHVTALIGKKSRAQIVDAVKRAGAAAGRCSTVWLYFAGHGATDSSTSARMVMPANAPTDTLGFAAAGIPLPELEAVATVGGGKVITVVDACYVGVGRDGGSLLQGGARMFVPPSVKPPERGANWLAVEADQVAYPLDAAEHGAFTYALLGARRGWTDGVGEDRVPLLNVVHPPLDSKLIIR